MSKLTGVQSDIELAVWHMIINLPKAVNRREGGGGGGGGITHQGI